MKRYLATIAIIVLLAVATACTTNTEVAQGTTALETTAPETTTAYIPQPTQPTQPLATAELFFIFEESCSACDGTEYFFAMVDRVLGDYVREKPNEIHTINIFPRAGYEQFRELALRYLNEENPSTQVLPILIVGGQAFYGFAHIEDNLLETFLGTWGS